MKNSGAWLENKEIVLKQFWKNLFVGEISPDKYSILQYTQSKDIDIDIEKNYIPLLVSIKKVLEGFSKEEQRLMEYAIKNMAEELFMIEGSHKEVIAFNENSILVMFELDQYSNKNDFTELIKTSCQMLIKVVKQHFKMIISCYVGIQDSIYMIPNQIEKLQVIDFQNVAYQDISLLESYKHYHIEYNNSMFSVWSELIQSNKFYRVLDEIKQMLTAEESLKKIDRKFLQNFYQDYYYILIVFSVKRNIFLSELFGDDKSLRTFQNALNSLDSLLDWVEYTIEVIKTFVDRNESIVNPVDKTKKHIENHI